MNKHINKEIGMNAINSYKRAANILDKSKKIFLVDLMLFYLEKMRKKSCTKQLMRLGKLSL